MSTPFGQSKQAPGPKPIPAAAGPTAHPAMDEEVHVNADLYRTFSPSDVAMWDWRSEMQKSNQQGQPAKTSSGFLSKLFGFK